MLYPSKIYVKIFTTPKLKSIIAMEATKLPKTMVGKANLILILRRAAIRLPLQTPVPGRGIATKKNKPI